MKLRIYLVSAGLVLVALVLGSSRPIEAIGGCIPGTYLALEGSTTHSLWTFSSDGTFQAASAAQNAFVFSDTQGTWRRDNSHTVRAVGLNFSLLPEPVGPGVPPQFTNRIDATLEFARDCQNFEGEFELRFYLEGEDPLDPDATGTAATDTVTARRLQVP